MTTDPDAERWLPLAEAAHLGLSCHQLRRRVRASQIASRQVVTPYGPAYEVRVDPDARHPGAAVTVTPP